MKHFRHSGRHPVQHVPHPSLRPRLNIKNPDLQYRWNTSGESPGGTSVTGAQREMGSVPRLTVNTRLLRYSLTQGHQEQSLAWDWWKTTRWRGNVASAAGSGVKRAGRRESSTREPVGISITHGGGFAAALDDEAASTLRGGGGAVARRPVRVGASTSSSKARKIRAPPNSGRRPPPTHAHVSTSSRRKRKSRDHPEIDSL